MKVLSLFDGMACGALALQAAGIEIESYDAFEIDEKTANADKGRPFGFAALTAQHNFPFIKHHGDVFKADFTQFKGVDLVCGGSPCTYWSIAQKNNRETEASGMGWELFQQYVRAIKEAEPKYFIYENNKSMSKAIRESIDKAFGFEAVLINSALVSAQNRQRLYWVGKRNADGTYSKVNVEQPEDRGILLKDILEGGWRIPEYGSEDKSRPVGALYAKNAGGFEHRLFSNNPNKQQVDMVVEPVCMTYKRSDEAKRVRKQYEQGEISHGFRELSELHPRTDGKSNVLSTVLKDNPILEPVGIGYRGRIENGKWIKQYESNGIGKANALTTAQTDSMVAAPICVRSHRSQSQRIYAVDGKGITLSAQGGGAGAKTGLYAIACASKTVEGSIPKLEDKYGYVPEMFNAYNAAEITDKSPSLTTGSMVTSSCAVNRFEAVCGYAIPVEWDEEGRPTKAVSAADGKTYTVYEVKDGKITIKGKQYPIKLPDGFYIIRKLTVRECMRLQTVPEWYEFPVSDSQAYKMIGNGWTVEVISHLLKSIIVQNFTTTDNNI